MNFILNNIPLAIVLVMLAWGLIMLIKCRDGIDLTTGKTIKNKGDDFFADSSLDDAIPDHRNGYSFDYDFRNN